MKVTIVIPTYNLADYCVRAVESVLAQTYSPIEIIVVDDGSTDDTKERLAIFENKIRYIYKENGGVCSARNRGLQEAQGDIVACLDSDDQYAPEKVAECVAYFEKHPKVGLVHTNAQLIDENDAVLSNDNQQSKDQVGWIASNLIQGNFICNPTVMFRKECFGKVGGFDESMFAPADWDMWLRIAEQYQVGYIDKPLSRYRVVSGSCYNDLEKTRQEISHTLKRFKERNPNVPQRVMAKAWARHHLSMAQCYVLKNDWPNIKREFCLSLKSYLLNFRAIGLLLYYIFARKSLMKRLERRILRNPA